MSRERHWRALERMYLGAPINRFYHPRIEIGDAGATIEIDLSERFFHPLGAAHGSVYFKMLDDAAFFAVSAEEEEVFVLTSAFTTYLTRPVSEGVLRSVGRVVSRTRSQWIAEAVAYDEAGREVGRGSGIFVRSRVELSDAEGYRLEGDS